MWLGGHFSKRQVTLGMRRKREEDEEQERECEMWYEVAEEESGSKGRRVRKKGRMEEKWGMTWQRRRVKR